MILILNVKNIGPAEIRCQFLEVYEEVGMIEGNACKWCHLFNGVRADAHN
jgi:hypothetical protein